MLRTQLSHVRVLIAVRDPRDMLLDWIAFRAPLMLRVESPLQMAQWLARHLEHVAVLHENSPIIYALIKLDEIHGDPAAVAANQVAATNAHPPAPPAPLSGPQTATTRGGTAWGRSG